MKGPAGSYRYFPKNYSGSATIPLEDLVHYGQFIQSGSGYTLTIPTPIRDLVGREIELINMGSGNLTVACTSGFLAAVNNYTVPTKTKLVLECVETVPGTYKWSPILDPAGTTLSTTTIGALIAAATAKATPIDADIVGFADTESSPANLLKKATWANVKAFLKTYFDTLYTAAAHDTATTGVHGVAGGTIAKVADIPTKAAGSDIDTGTNDAKFVTAKAIADSAIGDVTAWATFDPTSYITWAVATPAAMTLAGYYRLISGTAEFKVYVVSADPSNNVGKIGSMTFPVGWQPKQLSMHYPIMGLHRKDTGGANTPTTMQAWIDASQAVAANRVITFMNAVVWADNEATELMFSGSFQYV